VWFSPGGDVRWREPYVEMKRLLTVEDTFMIEARGLVVVPAPPIEAVRGPGDLDVELHFPDGRFQVMECDDRRLLDEWMANWSDITDFEVVPVLTSAQAREAVAPRL
jgi:hypothetical protein